MVRRYLIPSQKQEHEIVDFCPKTMPITSLQPKATSLQKGNIKKARAGD
jgi:hypothetical protein